MKHVPQLVHAVAISFLLPVLSIAGQQKKIVVGILPTYDISGQAYGPSVSQMLTILLFEEYSANPRFAPIYLNPGSRYDPTSTAFAAEYAQTLDTPIDLILSTTFVEPEDPKKGALILHLKATQLDPKTGDPMLTWNASKPLKERNAFLTYAQGRYGSSMGNSNLLFEPSREFRKQPLGKAATELALQIVQLSAADAARLPATGDSPSISSANSCKIHIKVNYKEKHAISKSYTCFINDRDETLGVREGLLDVDEHDGRLLIILSLNDKPYKLPVQDIYHLDPVLDCSSSSHTLNIDIGAAGEARTTWH